YICWARGGKPYFCLDGKVVEHTVAHSSHFHINAYTHTITINLRASLVRHFDSIPLRSPKENRTRWIKYTM
ncbi:unnamed protein product, partial [Amoebophrya sp. A120]